MQTMAEEPGKPKRVVSTSYAPVSCDECYAQKRKCAWPDDGSAACVRCARLSLACRFDRPAKNKLARRKELQAKVGTGQSRGQRTSMEAATTMIPQDLTKEELDAMLSELAETGYLPDVEYGYDAAGAKVEYEEEEYFEEDDGAQMAFEDNSMLEHILETPPGSRMATSAGFFGAEPDYTAPDAFIIPQDDFREKSMGSFSSAGSQGGEPPISNLSSPVSAAPSARKTAPLPKTSSFASRPKSTDRLSSLLDSTSGTPGHLSFAVTLGLSQPSTNPPTASDIFAKVPMPFTTSPELTMLLNVYFDNVAPHIEFIHRSSFFSSLASQPQYLLDSMTALAVPFLPGVSGMLHLTKTLIHRASSNLMSIEPLPRALPAAWTFIHLALHALLHESSTQRALALAHGYHAMASSTAHSLRKAAHMRGKPPPSRDWVESEQRRRTWFSVWMIGTVLEAASGQRQPSAYVDSLLPVPCSDTVWRRNRGKRETEEEEKEESEEMGMFVDFGLDDEGGTGQVDVESPQAEDTPSPKPSQQQPKQRKESIQTYTKQFASLQTQDIPASLEKYFEPIGAPFSPMATPPQPPHNAFAGIVELHALLENAMYVARGEVKRDKDKVATERALLRWEEMWDQRKAEIGAKVWFGGMIMLRTAVGLVNGIPSAGFRHQSLRIARLLAPLTDEQLLHIGPPYICLSIHSAGLALLELLDSNEQDLQPSPRRGIEVCLNALKLHAMRWPLARNLCESLETAIRRWRSDRSEEFLWTGLGSLDLGEEEAGSEDDEERGKNKARKRVGGIQWGTVEVAMEDGRERTT